ncbi:hypothetical protein D3C76_674240 [compost metagenome]
MRLLDAQRQVGVIELIVAHPQAVAWLAGIDRVGAIGEGIAQGLQATGGGEQFGLGGLVHVRTGAKGADAKPRPTGAY